MDNWKDLFREIILVRGLAYFQQGLVSSLEKTAHGYRAAVKGTQDYKVEILMREDSISGMHCTCPYAEGGQYCKHMAAVLFKIDGSERKESVKEAAQRERREIAALVTKLSVEELRKYVEELAFQDEDFKIFLMIRHGKNIDARQMKVMKERIREIAYEYSDRSGFIDYRNAWKFNGELEDFLNGNVRELIDRQNHMQAFELVNQVFHTIGNAEMDDSDGGSASVGELCYTCWKDILNQCNAEEKDKMFRWFKEHLYCDYVVDYMEEYMGAFVMKEFHDREHLLKKLEMLDEEIDAIGYTGKDSLGYTHSYSLVHTIKGRIAVMRELGCTEDEILQYRSRYRGLAEIRKLEAEEFVEQENYDEAIRVLVESKEMDRQESYLVYKYSQQLIDLYEQTGRKVEYKEELICQIFMFGQNDTDYIMRLKKICAEEEWDIIRKQFLDNKSSHSQRCVLLEYEKMYPQLMEEIEKAGDVYNLSRYIEVLSEIHPERVRDLLVKDVQEEVVRAKSVDRYQYLVNELKRIEMYPGGTETASKIAASWRNNYRRKKNLMKELDKGGF